MIALMKLLISPKGPPLLMVPATRQAVAQQPINPEEMAMAYTPTLVISLAAVAFVLVWLLLFSIVCVVFILDSLAIISFNN
jgi:hypothetical protein